MSAGHLLDTQVLILWRTDSSRLGRKASRLLEDPDSRLFFSQASVWEICIKRSLGKLDMEISTQEFVHSAVSAGISLLELRPQHLYRVESIPWHHRDPFDRLLIAQALIEDLTLVAADRVFQEYGVSLVW
jgi:PIN domain nuclease of toxin-antitoxin system